jgi:hypothetical protein
MIVQMNFSNPSSVTLYDEDTVVLKCVNEVAIQIKSGGKNVLYGI